MTVKWRLTLIDLRKAASKKYIKAGINIRKTHWSFDVAVARSSSVIIICFNKSCHTQRNNIS